MGSLMQHFISNNKKQNETKFLVSTNPSQNILRPIYEIKQGKTFMESIIADFTPISCIIAKFSFFGRETGR